MQDVKYLYRACKFADWCMDYGTHRKKIPDRPFSLFEGILLQIIIEFFHLLFVFIIKLIISIILGLAGTIYFLIDIQQPLSAKFPGYTI